MTSFSLCFLTVSFQATRTWEKRRDRNEIPMSMGTWVYSKVYYKHCLDQLNHFLLELQLFATFVKTFRRNKKSQLLACNFVPNRSLKKDNWLIFSKMPYATVKRHVKMSNCTFPNGRPSKSRPSVQFNWAQDLSNKKILLNSDI